MRKECMELLAGSMIANEDIIVLTADLGFGILDPIKKSYENTRFFNMGAAEQLMIGTAIGLAEEGKIPVCYSISSFLLCRPFESLRNYVNHENIPVKLIGSGRDNDYEHDGFSHWINDGDKIMEALPNIKYFKPIDISNLENIFNEFLFNGKPSYLNLTRKI